MYLYELNPPVRWSAGSCGAEQLFFDCADCGAAEPIAGVASTKPLSGGGIHPSDLAVVERITDGRKTYHNAMFCKACFGKRQGS